MARQLMATLLVGVLMGTPLIAQTNSGNDKHARFVQKVKAGVRTIGTGTEAKVKVTLRDKTRLSGYIRQAGEEGFDLVNAKTGVAATVPYEQVRKLRGHGVSVGSTFSPLEIGGIAAVVFALALPFIVIGTAKN